MSINNIVRKRRDQAIARFPGRMRSSNLTYKPGEPSIRQTTQETGKPTNYSYTNTAKKSKGQKVILQRHQA